MDPAFGMERQLNINIHKCNRRFNRRDNFGNGNQFMRDKFCQYIGCNSNNSPCPARRNIREYISLPGFSSDLQHISRFWGNFLYLDIAFGMERQLNINIHKCNRRNDRRDHFGNGDQFMRDRYCQYIGCNGNNSPSPARRNIREYICLPGFSSDLQHIDCVRRNLIHMDIAVGLDRKFNNNIYIFNGRFNRRDHFGNCI
jgi:hypothetical protein